MLTKRVRNNTNEGFTSELLWQSAGKDHCNRDNLCRIIPNRQPKLIIAFACCAKKTKAINFLGDGRDRHGVPIMKISAKTEYACIAMLELASRYGSTEPVRIRKIAERHDVPPRFLVQILLQLKGAGLVASTRGAAGGYHLIKPPQDVSLGEVMQVIEGGAKHREQSTSASPNSPAVKALVQAWQEVEAVERDMLQKITFAELLERAKGHDDRMYYI
jgi:Rrf2 family protein